MQSKKTCLQCSQCEHSKDLREAVIEIEVEASCKENLWESREPKETARVDVVVQKDIGEAEKGIAQDKGSVDHLRVRVSKSIC